MCDKGKDGAKNNKWPIKRNDWQSQRGTLAINEKKSEERRREDQKTMKGLDAQDLTKGSKLMMMMMIVQVHIMRHT